MEIMLLLAAPVPPPDLDLLGELVSEELIETPYGKVSRVARRRGKKCELLEVPYFGTPDRTDPRAVIWAAREMDVRWVIGWESVVAISPHLVPGDIVIPDDYIDMVRHQPATFFEEGGMDYVGQTPPFCPEARNALLHVLSGARPKGVYIGVDGPRRETAAEARMFRSWGADLRGMNLVPEVYLAKELGVCFAAVLTVSELAADIGAKPMPRAINKGIRRTLLALSEIAPY